MVSLQKLGIECDYNPNKPEELHYLISIEPGRLKNPKRARKHFGEIINAISKDASEKGGLDHLTLLVDKEYLGNLQSVARELLSTAQEHKSSRTNWDNTPTLPKVLVISGAIGGGLAGLVFSYDQMTEWATNVAEYMNNTSHLWAPIAGLTQAAISVLGTAATTAIGATGGAIGGGIASSPYMAIRAPLASRVESYRSLEQALSRVESRPKETI
jgi:hypothetical protein